VWARIQGEEVFMNQRGEAYAEQGGCGLKKGLIPQFPRGRGLHFHRESLTKREAPSILGRKKDGRKGAIANRERATPSSSPLINGAEIFWSKGELWKVLPGMTRISSGNRNTLNAREKEGPSHPSFMARRTRRRRRARLCLGRGKGCE